MEGTALRDVAQSLQVILMPSWAQKALAAACGSHEARPVTPLEPEPGVAEFQPITLSAIPNHPLSCRLQTQPVGNRPVTTGPGARAGRGSGGRKGGEDGRWLVLRWERGTYKR